ncbi:MAG: radical SAM protein [Dehalogenimonas sp.]
MDLSKYRDVGIIATRGCPYSCTFCSDKSFHKGYVNALSAERLVGQLETLQKKWGYHFAFFAGENFAEDKAKLREFCSLVAKKKLKVKWNCRVSGSLDEEAVSLMARSGCTSVVLEIESGSQRVLDFLGKGNVQDLEKTFWLLVKHHIVPTVFMMYGFPTETEEDFQKTLDLLRKLDNPPSHLMKFVPYPKTRLLDYCVEKGYFKAPETLGDWVDFNRLYYFDKNLSSIPSDSIALATESFRNKFAVSRLRFTLKYRPAYLLTGLRDPMEFIRQVAHLIGNSIFVYLSVRSKATLGWFCRRIPSIKDTPQITQQT